MGSGDRVGSGFSPGVLALLPALAVVAGIAAGVLAESLVAQTVGSLVGLLLAVVLYFGATRRERGPERHRAVRSAQINLGLILLFVLANYLYGLSNQPIGETHSVKTAIDDHIPVVAPFVIPYLGAYPFVVFTVAYLGVLAKHRALRTLLLGLIGSTTAGLITFAAFQTYVTPPARSEWGPEPFRAMIAYVEDTLFAGNYYSAFPSLHVAYSMVLAIAWWRLRRPVLSPVLIVFSALIMLATQFLHQHYLLDLVYGLVLGAAAYLLSWWLTEARTQPHPAPQTGSR